MTTAYKLYSTSACHLCEEAATILSGLQDPRLTWEEIEIATSDELLHAYGTRIPVLSHQRSGQELNWPFTENDVIHLLERTVTIAS